ncbi:MAG: aldo/keto reductase, partial [Micromonosporaceae bacterium]
GTWHMRGQSGYQAIKHALTLGYRLLDTATMYDNEAEVGRAIRDSGLPREEIFLTTKLPPQNVGRERKTIQESLSALGTDYVDLWLIHWPPGGASPETWQELLAARQDGLARAVGVSNYSTSQIDELIEATGQAPAVNQIEWSPSLHDAHRLAEHRDRGVVMEGYSPFKNTDLSDPTLADIAAKHQVTPSQVVLRWHLEHGIVAIPKSSRPERQQTNFDVYGFSLSTDEVAQIDSIT